MSELVTIYHNIEGLEYDIYGVFKAFFPESVVKIEKTDKPLTQSDLSGDLWNIFLSPEELRIYYTNLTEHSETVSESYEFHYDSEIGISRKNLLKRIIYKALKEKCHMDLPWGTLTGIRPIKLMARILEDTGSIEKTKEIAKRDYLISDEKLELSIDIAIGQKQILKKIPDNSFSLYISIPFCPSICSYCSFPSDVYKRALPFMDSYMECLCRELEATARLISGNPISIYIGGGTPSVIDRKYLIQLFECLSRNFNLNQSMELTFEAGRPDSMDEELFRILKEYPVSRLSINPQTMNDYTLRLIGRKHTASDIVEAFELAERFGFDNINSDLILGLPGEGEIEVRKSLKELLNLNIKSLTIHSLSVKKGSKLKENEDSHSYITNKKMNLFHQIATTTVENKGMKPYYLYRQKDIAGNLENIGYSFEGYEGIYNILILEEKHTIIGVGAGAVTKRIVREDDRIIRVPNIKDAKLYIERFEEALTKKIGLGENV